MSSSYDQLLANSALSGLSSDYIDDLYDKFLQDENSVSESWRVLFMSLIKNEVKDISHLKVRENFIKLADKKVVVSGKDSKLGASTSNDISFVLAVMNMIEDYRVYGHLKSSLSFLEQRNQISKLSLSYYGLSSSDNERKVNFCADVFENFVPKNLGDLRNYLEKVYCGSIGFEYKYITNDEQIKWLEENIQEYYSVVFSKEEKLSFLESLIRAEVHESYLHRKYVGQKRFSVEGGESIIPLLEQVIRQSSALGYSDIVLGMAHRGRLSVMINVLGMSCAQMEEMFEGIVNKEGISGDVKYHLGYSSYRDFDGREVHISLGFNPSHLEAIAPVIMGEVRARIDKFKLSGEKNKSMAILLHGDSAVSGQGVVYESLNMSYTKANNIDGSVRIVINNQIGYTTEKSESRSMLYCTDVAKVIEAPVMHVDADNVEAVMFCANLAANYKSRFKRDIFIDMICYRKYGHNEGDEPRATQPEMYKKIAKHPGVLSLYADILQKEGVIDKDYLEKEKVRVLEQVKSGKRLVRVLEEMKSDRYESWLPYFHEDWQIKVDTSKNRKYLQDLSARILAIPKDFNLQKQVKMMHQKRLDMMQTGKNINWGMAEMLVFASLLEDGYSIRLQGQDSLRGTFAHRHLVYYDQENGKKFMPLKDNMPKYRKNFMAYNSVLSEYSALAFEYGYAETSPDTLVLWEAQFGDFVNNAQVVIDQFITSAWQKWQRMCGLVMLLPHGYEGLGPEHSSARLERFLQLCAQENYQVCMPSLPSQFFHLLRRQLLRPYRRPLVVMTPKSLLRHPLATSDIDDLVTGSFRLLIPEQKTSVEIKKCKRLIVCSGKVYYDLIKVRGEHSLEDVHIARLEQLYPFPKKELTDLFKSYCHLDKVIWCQEEPHNQGSWYSLRHRLESCLYESQKLKYAGREKMASPAAGDKHMHDKLQAKLVLHALGLERNPFEESL